MISRISLLIVITLFSIAGSSQKLTYADVLKNDRKSTSFNILGKVDDNYLIYKNYNNRHYITSYDRDMKMLENVELELPVNRLLNIDFVSYPSRVLVIYQYQKGSTVYCNALFVDNKGKSLGPTQTIDTSRVGFFAESKIYTTAYSDDRSKILVVKMPKLGSGFNIMTKVFDPSLNLLDSAREYFEYNRSRDTYKEFKIANDGSIVFIKEVSRLISKFAKELFVYDRRMGEPIFAVANIDLMDHRLDDSYLKIDNLNGNYIVAAFALPENRNLITELFTAVVPLDTAKAGRISFQTIADSTLLSAGNRRNINADAFDRFFIKDLVLKRDGSFLLLTEESYSEFRTNPYDRFNRNLYYNQFMYNPNYYMYDPYYARYNYYDPLRSRNSRDNNQYYANNVVVFSFNNDLKINWTNAISKTQSDSGTEDYLSYALANFGAELNLLFIGNSRNREVVNNFGIQPNGFQNRYPTLKANSKGIGFMPAYAKQVGPKQVIMPASTRNNITFVKIDF